MKRVLFAVAVLVGAEVSLAPSAAKSEDASWGCQVLLCAASRNPSWHGIGYCVPPMTKLISAIKKPGFSWPVCQEAKAGNPGYQTYEDCPAGTTIGYGTLGKDGSQGEPNRCVKTVNRCQSIGNGDTAMWNLNSSSSEIFSKDNGCMQKIAALRPRRADPFFFDIPNDQGVMQRFWFNLNY